jgi:hypothetical protein
VTKVVILAVLALAIMVGTVAEVSTFAEFALAESGE